MSGPADFVADYRTQTLAILAQASGWLSARDLLSRLALPDSESNRRNVRAIAEESHGAIISGQQGYRLTDLATVEEVRHFVASMRSQCRKMESRAELALSRKSLEQLMFAEV